MDRVIAHDYRLPEDELLEEDEESVSQMMEDLGSAEDDDSLPF